ncbi:MAG TPA: prolipoprotein diacylglyceryl transferase [Eubacteriales bacterium]|nr:prolipoprotein diacylglyceryl transferase [Clostridia bacterium]HRV72868.1 prolipoprotein diacylglyceryl transferase [Eubacteriales bacterium]
MHPTFDLGFIQIPAMGICILIGTIFGLALLFFIRKYSYLSRDNILDSLLWAVLLGFVGMKILYWITEPQILVDTFTDFTFKKLYHLISEGMVFYGGLLGGILGLVFCSLKTKKRFFAYSDLLAPCFCLAHAGGRIGCLMAGCCYGMEYDGACHIVLSGVSRFPSPLAEFILLIGMSVTLTLILRKSRHSGTVTAFYLIIYSVGRFILEFFRGDAERGFVGALSTSQFISIFILLAGLVILWISRKQPSDKPLPAEAETVVNDKELPQAETADSAPDAEADNTDATTRESDNK